MNRYKVTSRAIQICEWTVTARTLDEARELIESGPYEDTEISYSPIRDFETLRVRKMTIR